VKSYLDIHKIIEQNIVYEFSYTKYTTKDKEVLYQRNRKTARGAETLMGVTKQLVVNYYS
jgi:hypothetical protein